MTNVIDQPVAANQYLADRRVSVLRYDSSGQRIRADLVLVPQNLLFLRRGVIPRVPRDVLMDVPQGSNRFIGPDEFHLSQTKRFSYFLGCSNPSRFTIL